ncbi:MAG: methyltransferase [Bacilli bacterium]|nr:methyltransferase [Bacilli bacterium]
MSIVLNDLFDYDGMKIYQDSDKFKFSLDSILLAEFVDNLNVDTIVDFCTGNAPVPLILSTKTKAKIYGFEIQKNIYDLAVKSIDTNNLNQQIVVYNDNLKEVSKYLKDECADLVTCNPPYFKYKDVDSLINEDKEKAIARHEITMDLDSLIKSAKYVLKNKAPLYMVHRCDRLEEVIDTLNKYGFKVKKLQFIYAGFNKEAIMVLIKATKNGNSGSLKVMPPIDILNLKSYKGIFERVK